MTPNDVPGASMLVDLPAVAEREQEDLPLYQLPRTRGISEASAYVGMSSSRYATGVWYGIISLFSPYKIGFCFFAFCTILVDHLVNTENIMTKSTISDNYYVNVIGPCIHVYVIVHKMDDIENLLRE